MRLFGAGRRPARAARLLGAAKTLYDATGSVLMPVDRAEYEGTVTALCAPLGEAAFAAAWAEGAAMSIEEAVARSLSAGDAHGRT